MGQAIQIAVGGALALAGWLIPRRVAETRNSRWRALLLDLFPALLVGSLILTATGRPILTGVVLVALGAGFALADRTKREVLREPVVFSEMSELRHVFTHPHLYLPFAGPALVVGGAVTAVAVCVALLSLEPGLWSPDPLLMLCYGGLVVFATWLMSREPALGATAAVLRGFDATGEPFSDAASLGPFAMVLVYGVIARAERPARQARHAPPPAPSPALRCAGAGVPLVLVQCESFFDARRLSPQIPQALLAGYDACCESGGTFGRLDVPGWGANTMRAEFAVLTGMPESELGYDRFNPYHAFARAPVTSLAWRLRNQGYRTLCLHPFDRSFFRRDLALPGLGFETFLGLETLGGSRRPPYYADPDLAYRVLEVLNDEGPRVFIFVITMGNHGPWHGADVPVDPGLRRTFDATGLPQGDQLMRYLDGLRKSDEMLQILLCGLQQSQRDGVLAFYGDHLPSLPHAFGHLGFDDWGSDYVVWEGAAAHARQLNLPAYRLSRILMDALYARGAIEEGRDEAALVPTP